MLITGGVAQMVERSLSMREVPGSIPGISKLFKFVPLSSHAEYQFQMLLTVLPLVVKPPDVSRGQIFVEFHGCYDDT